MILVDMHVHSTYSDGTCSVEQLARRAKQRGLSLLALTDHDTIDGLASFMRECGRCGVPALTGVELATDESFTLHILGYRIDPHDAKLANNLAVLRRLRGERNAAVCEKLRGLGMDITLEEVEAEADGEVVGRPHIASVMIRKGYVVTSRQAFDKYLKLGSPAYVRRDLMSAEECISMIRDAGGLPVMAHPYQTRLEDTRLKKLVARLKDAGLWGIETVYTGYSAEQIFELMQLAGRYSLYPTAGSDFHNGKNGFEIGMSVSDDFLPLARLGVR